MFQLIEKVKIEFDKYKIENLFLIFGLLITITLSLSMPLFNEPDGQYHFAVSSRIVNSSVDTSRYGVDHVVTGMSDQKESYQNGTHFEKYYLNKAKIINSSIVPRNIRFSYHNYVFFGHVVPAIGIFIGRLIYPSLGIMITCGRIFSSFIYVIALFLVIKKLKYGKLVFATIFLSPVVMNLIASLSYDAASILAVSVFLMLNINILAEPNKELPIKSLISSIIFLIIASKQNYWIIILILFFTLFESKNTYTLKYRKIILDILYFIKSRKLFFLLSGLSLFLVFLYVICIPQGGIKIVLQRYFMTIVFDYKNSFTLNSWLAEPYPGYSNMPSWVTALWIVLLVIVLLSEEKFVINLSLSIFALFLFIIGMLGVYYIQLSYGADGTSYIKGVQGRYFTPTLLLLLIFVAGIGNKLILKKSYYLTFSVVISSILTNLMVIFNTIIDLKR
ncbi:hypothetical protein A9Q68_03620 [Streptococcus bovimastitidis]|uniref:Beta-carotene 15,15'-monooxygenase n=1 Tax=Streptococcus bovimastitidis TaxID=1856638 RepID=A0A1L8MPH8_9STRE|nr:DUF2142 domain-containing protein [Streptococcus bovimastitidis]OJF72647.1 hypothetical protein A9Q68_03620 [Streptococcus bovimastitidis]